MVSFRVPLLICYSGKELWFDFGPPKKLTRADFRRHFGHLRFDTILQYVAFPQIELDDHKQIPDRRYAGKEVGIRRFL